MAEIAPIRYRSKDGRDFLVRHGAEADARALIECAQSYINDGDGQVMVPGEFTKTEAQQREWIKGLREAPDELLLVAEHQGRVIGNIDFHIGKRSRISHTGVFGMGVMKEWRSQGVGSALLGELINWAIRNEAVEKIKLRVLANNEKAIGLYRKFGFKEEGRSVREIKLSDGTYVDDFQMALFVNARRADLPDADLKAQK